MSKQGLTVIALFSIIALQAQKVDIDNYRVEMEVANIPEKFIESDKRTFHIQVKGPGAIASSIKKEDLKLYGFKQVEKDGTLKLVIDVNSMIQGSPSLSTRVDEKKDKDGKVISRTNYYSYSSNNYASSFLTIYGPISEKELAEEAAKLKEKESKKKDKDKDKDKAKAAENPFLKNASNSAAPAAGSTDEVTANYKKIKTKDLNTSYYHTGAESTSTALALNNYNVGAAAAYNNNALAYPADVVNNSSSEVNSLYGYYPIKLTYQKMKILDSEKHPEYTTFKQATEAAKVIFKNFKYNSDIVAFRKDFEPILEYFTALDAKLGTKEKHEKKLKAAALYNIAMINYSLDNFEASEAACKKMIFIDQDADDAEDIVEKIKEVTPKMDKYKMTTRHIKE